MLIVHGFRRCLLPWTLDNMPLGKMTDVMYRSLVSIETLLYDEVPFQFR